MTTITDFNHDTLTAQTPLTRWQAVMILTLVDKSDCATLNKILNGAVPFNPQSTYFPRLKQSLILGQI